VTRMFLRALTVLIVVLGVASVHARAQTGQMYGELVGKITDTQGAVLPGVIVTLTGPAAMGSMTAVSNEQGQYRFPAVSPGTYKLVFRLSGFSELVRDGIVVPVRTTITVDSLLKVASVQEAVTVTGASPTVDIENTKVGARLDHELLTNVPTSRTIFGATTVLPGMVMGRQDPGGLTAATSTGMVAHGQSRYNLNYYGVTADTPQDYGSMYYMDYGSAQEISVDTAAMGAEIGGGGGANINVVPKSGGNQVKGEALYATTGRGVWSGFSGSNVTDELRAQGIKDPSLQRLEDFNANGGGPILRDRLWWFGSIRNYSTVENVAGFPIPFDSNLRNYTASGKYQINRNNHLSAFWTYNRKFQPHRNAGVAQPDPINTLNQQSPKNLFNGNWTSVINQNTFLEVSSSYFHMHWPSDWSDEFKALPADLQHSTTFNNTTKIYIDGPEPTGQRFRDGYRQQTNIGLTRYINHALGAGHQLKLGFENWYGWGSDGFNIFNDTRLRYNSAPDGTNLVPFEIFAYNTPLKQRTRMRNFAAFGQDRLTYSRFTLNLGLRWSYYDGELPEQSGGGGRWFPLTTYPAVKSPYAWKTFAPRTGLVYKITADGKNVAKVAYSKYFEPMYTGELDAINQNIIQTGGVATYAWLGDANGNGIVDDNEFNHTPKSTFTPKANSIDPNLRNPKLDEILVSYQREVISNVSFSASWIQRWFNDSTIDQDRGGSASPISYAPKSVNDPGPDNLLNTGDDRTLTFYNRTGTDVFFHTNCGNGVSIKCTQRYKGLEVSLARRMSNRWQLAGSYVWSRLDGDRVLDYTDPNNQIDFVRSGRGSNDQPHAFKLLGSYLAPWDVTLGANYQALSGLPRDRNLSVSLTQGSTTYTVEPRGSYRQDFLNLLSVRADKRFRVNGQHGISVIAEVHNLLNTSAGQNSYGTATQAFASQAAFDAARLSTAYFGRVQEIVAPRVLKVGIKLEF
jgi:Carboxypeptidase regulatory-like domain